MNINLKDEIVILDEAHNTEDACRESTTLFITKFQIETALAELSVFVKHCFDEEKQDSAAYFCQVVKIYVKNSIQVKIKN